MTNHPPTSPQTSVRGNRKRLPRSRQLILDVLHQSRKVPGIPVLRQCNVAAAAEARRHATPRIGWPALFIKAFATVAAGDPVLRQTFMPWPWPHLYQHPLSTARMTVAREHEGYERVFFAEFVEPNRLPLAQLQAQIEAVRDAPVESHPKFRNQITFSRVPTLLRRIAWWAVLNVSGRARVGRLGTFGVTTVSARGAVTLHPPSIYTSMLSFGRVAPSGEVPVVLVYDHRVTDGFHIAGVLSEIEDALNGPIAYELREMAGPVSDRREEPAPVAFRPEITATITE